MKVVSFFSRFAMICNISFVVYLILKELEIRRHASGQGDVAVPVPYLKDIIITLGVAAIFINMAMCIVYITLISVKKKRLVPKWMAIINTLFLIFQFWYFFIRRISV